MGILLCLNNIIIDSERIKENRLLTISVILSKKII